MLDHPRAVATALAGLVVAALVLGFPPKIEPNLLALLPPDDPASIALTELHETEGGANLVTLAFEGPDERVAPFLEVLEADLEQSERVRFAVHDIDEALATRIGLLQLDVPDVEELTIRMKGALALGPALNPMVSNRLMAMGPVTERIQAAAEPTWVPGASGGGGRLLVRPTGSSHDPQFSLALIEEIEGLVEARLEEHPGITLSWMGGSYRDRKSVV